MNALKAGLLEARNEFRHNLVIFLSSTLVTTTLVVGSFWYFGVQTNFLTALFPVMVVNFIIFIIPSVLGTASQERLQGNFVRVRALPNGPRNWMVGKTIYNMAETMLVILAVSAGLLLLVLPPMTQPQYLILLSLFASVSTVVLMPYALFAGVAFKSIWGGLLGTVVAIALYALVVVPIDLFPTWARPLLYANPLMWITSIASNLSPYAQTSFTELYANLLSPWIAAGLLTALGIIGWGFIPKIAKKCMQKESITTMRNSRSKMSKLSGM